MADMGSLTKNGQRDGVVLDVTPVDVPKAAEVNRDGRPSTSYWQ